MRRVAITGATGFLGRRCAEMLAARGDWVVALGRRRDVLEAMAPHVGHTAWGDLGDRRMLAQAFRRCDAVVHCAALSSPWGRRADFEATNVAGTESVLAACREAGVARLVAISTPSIYMRRAPVVDVREDDPLPPRFINDYARTKFEAEQRVRESGIEAIILRPQGIFGPRDASILPRLMVLGRRGILPCFGDGSQRIDLTFVDNVVDAIDGALQAPAHAWGRAYNITNGEPVNQLDTIESILRELAMPVRRRQLPFWPLHAWARAVEMLHHLLRPDIEPAITAYGLCALAFTRTLNIDAAHQHLGYQPRIGMAEGLAIMTQWAKDHGLDPARR